MNGTGQYDCGTCNSRANAVCSPLGYDPLRVRDIYLLNVIGLKPGGSNTVHVYTQTIHRTTQLIWERVREVPAKPRRRRFSRTSSCVPLSPEMSCRSSGPPTAVLGPGEKKKTFGPP